MSQRGSAPDAAGSHNRNNNSSSSQGIEGMLSPPSYSHSRHTHNHSYDDAANADVQSDDEEDASAVANGRSGRYDPAAVFPSPPRHLSRPPAHQTGLVADPNALGDVRGTAGAGSGAVGRFTITEGSPLRVGDDDDGNDDGNGNDDDNDGGDDGDENGDDGINDDDDDDGAGGGRRGRMSPFPQERQDSDDQPAQLPSPPTNNHSHHQHHLSHDSGVVREFYVPYFPSMCVNGDGVTLSIGLSAPPRHGVYISPSCSGLSFSPPKLKWTGGEAPSAKEFSATPLEDAKEGKCKIVYCVGGDDAGEYKEPAPSVFFMYPEGTPLPLPLSEYDLQHQQQQEQQQQEQLRNSGEGCGDMNGNGNGHKADRAAFLAHGQPRQSGRFMVIDEEVVGSSPTQEPSLPGNDQPASPAPNMHSQHQQQQSQQPPSGARSADEAVDLLVRLQGCLANLMRDNERLALENSRLMLENAELRQNRGSRGSGYKQYLLQQQQQQHEDARFGRTAHISSYSGQQPQQHAAQAAAQPGQGRPRFATMPPSQSPVLSAVSGGGGGGVFANLAPLGATAHHRGSNSSPSSAAAAAAAATMGVPSPTPRSGSLTPSGVMSPSTNQQQPAQYPLQQQQPPQQPPKGHVQPVVMGQKRSSLPGTPSSAASAAAAHAHSSNQQRASLPSTIHMQNMSGQTPAATHPASPGGIRRPSPTAAPPSYDR